MSILHQCQVANVNGRVHLKYLRNRLEGYPWEMNCFLWNFWKFLWKFYTVLPSKTKVFLKSIINKNRLFNIFEQCTFWWRPHQKLIKKLKIFKNFSIKYKYKFLYIIQTKWIFPPIFLIILHMGVNSLKAISTQLPVSPVMLSLLLPLLPPNSTGYPEFHPVILDPPGVPNSTRCYRIPSGVLNSTRCPRCTHLLSIELLIDNYPFYITIQRNFSNISLPWNL